MSIPTAQRARALPVGQELEVGSFPLEPNTKSQNTHSGCHKPALLRLHVQPSGTHAALIVPASKGTSAKALPVLSVHELCQWCKTLKLDRSHWSQTPRAKTPIRAATRNPATPAPWHHGPYKWIFFCSETLKTSLGQFPYPSTFSAKFFSFESSCS
jgi:hypothetical protein